jgi:hypothetical protein
MLMKRRHFLFSSAATTAAASTSWAQANDRVRVAVIGVGSRGSAHIREMLPVQNVEIAALVDPDGNRTEQNASMIFQKTGKRPKLESDMRRVFDDKSIDAVTVATTNHWHALTAIWAMQAGKDAFVEKPVSHNILRRHQAGRNGAQVQAHGRRRHATALVGPLPQSHRTAPRRGDWRHLPGQLLLPGPPRFDRVQGDQGAAELAELGPVARSGAHAAVSREPVHYNWHWFWDFGNGELGNNGIHMIDILRWGMRKTLPVRVHSTGGRWATRTRAKRRTRRT